MYAQTRQVSEKRAIPGPAAEVWALLGDFNGLHHWHPAVMGSHLVGEPGQPDCLRNLVLVNGAQLQEALIDFDESRMSYRYRITAGPLPVSNYESEISVVKEGTGGCTVIWQSTFQAHGAPAQEAEQVIRSIYPDGLNQLATLIS